MLVHFYLVFVFYNITSVDTHRHFMRRCMEMRHSRKTFHLNIHENLCIILNWSKVHSMRRECVILMERVIMISVITITIIHNFYMVRSYSNCIFAWRSCCCGYILGKWWILSVYKFKYTSWSDTIVDITITNGNLQIYRRNNNFRSK